jgi:hypothetical protein
MRLTVSRSQELHTDRKGRSEGAIFHLSCRLELRPDERELVEKYRQSGYSVTSLQMDDIRDLQTKNAGERNLTVVRLSEGWTVQSRFAGDLLRAEKAITAGCGELKDVLEMLATYGGEDTVEI